METLLINWVYHRPVGHVIEAMRLARDFAAANGQLEISLLLNHEAPIELAQCHPSISHIYPIDLERGSSPRGFPPDLPREWDYVFTFPDVGTNGEAPRLDRFHEAFRVGVRSRVEEAAVASNKVESLVPGYGHTSQLSAQQVVERLAAPNQLRARAFDHYLRRARARVVVRGQGHAVCARIEQRQ